jgi:predicted acyltransferase
MRAHHAIAVVAVMLIGFGVKLFFFPVPAAEADTPPVLSASVDTLQMHIDHPNIKNLPPHKLRDMTFVFSDAD